jgi:hypothetical protein
LAEFCGLLGLLPEFCGLVELLLEFWELGELLPDWGGGLLGLGLDGVFASGVPIGLASPPAGLLLAIGLSGVWPVGPPFALGCWGLAPD